MNALAHTEATRGVGGVLAFIFLALALPPSAAAATFTVINSNDSGAGSLRQAITSANSLTDADIIAFDIPGPGPHVIALLSALPTISQPLTINGYSQPGATSNTRAVGNNAVIKIGIDGLNAGATSSGLAICEAGVTVRGLSITRFRLQGILVGFDNTGSNCTDPATLTVTGSFIGLAPDGTTALGNLGSGIRMNLVGPALIGGVPPGSRNVISANQSHGLSMSGGAGTQILNNHIGTDATGSLDRGNLARGIEFLTSADDYTVGSATAPNRIMFNSTGILVGASTSGNAIAANHFAANAALGIDLVASGNGPDGVTANDLNDFDTGGNTLQNFPVLTEASLNATGVHLAGTLDRFNIAGSLTFSIAAYAAASCDPSGHGEGEFLGATNFVSSGPAIETFSIDIATTRSLPIGTQISTTARLTISDDTSEFSLCEPLIGPVGTTVTNTNDSGAGSLRQAILNANANVDASLVAFNIAGAGPHVINVATALPTISQPAVIDGYSQPGSAVNTLADTSNAVIKIQLDGQATPAGVAGLAVCAADSEVRGLAIGNFGGHGLSLGRDAGGALCSPLPSGLRVVGNFLGLAADGSTAAGNVTDGVNAAVSSAVIGGANAADRNVISDNTRHGVGISGASTSVDGNLIGTDRTGVFDRGNFTHGVHIFTAATLAEIGSVAPNRIGFNSRGIVVLPPASGHTFYANDIGVNDQLGIDLVATGGSPDGVTPNDANDPDSGANNLQNFPVLTSVSAAPSSFTVNGSVDVPTTLTHPVTIAVYWSPTCDALGNGEGEMFLGAALRNLTNAAQTFAITLAMPVPAPGFITTTATRNGDTSEFSACLAAKPDLIFVNGFE